MSRIVYVNGRFKPYAQARIHVEDRGLQMADGVYEVCEVLDGGLVDEGRHLARLNRSLDELQIHLELSDKSLSVIMAEIIRRNHVRDGLVYLQITRGVAPRDFVFPAPGIGPGVICIGRSISRTKNDAIAARGINVITLPDHRWKRVDIKTTMLLPAVLARQTAHEADAYEAWLVDEGGMVTEGAASNAWIVTVDGTLLTRPCNDLAILRGVTRTVLLELIDREGLTLDERAFSVDEAKGAREAFVTGASTLVMPVVKIDDTLIGGGKPGEFSIMLRKLFHTQSEISGR